MTQAKTQPSFIAKSDDHPLLLVIILAGFALRLYRLGADSLWYDETVSAFLASEATTELIAHTARDIHPPGYYLLLHFWTLVAGSSEFVLAFFSLVFGLLLIPLTYQLARLLANRQAAIWAALLVAVSPYHLWYSQEVRMYTLGAVLGVCAGYCGLRALSCPDKSGSSRLFWAGYTAAAVMGLYTLYYFAFLLIVLNGLFFLYTLRSTLNQTALRSLVLTNGLVLLAYLPWLPTAWRQATEPPVPPWRTLDSFSPWPILLESWSVLSLGQSVEPAAIWPILCLTLVLFILGLLYLNYLPTFQPSNPPTLQPSNLFLLLYTFGPLLLIYLLSFFTPLYHVRYLFTYSPAFYIILGAGLAWLNLRTGRWLTLIAASLLVVACGFSSYQYYFNPRYRADDYRAAVDFIQSHWQPGDMILANAGYVYTAYLYYNEMPNLQRQRLAPYQKPADTSQPLLLQTGSVDGSPQLGWGDPQADFYAMSAAETVTALEAVSQDFARLWVLRAYDTVTDPNGLIRAWLAEQTIPLEDELFAGESNIRAQGFLLSGANALLQQNQTVQFADGLTLAGWSLPDQQWQSGQAIPIKLWWRAESRPGVDYKMSLKLWTPTAELAAQGQDTWPVGTLYRTTAWPIGQNVYQATAITLPPHLAPGQYWLNVELYHPDTGLPLSRLDGEDPVVTLGSVLVKG
ncbi:MAG: glycosyltransferase family 39 protein [Anaerolineae bacterium]|nr:glycosyltransferase family 39 protein [Anaerolineae bacterium]